MLDSEQTTRHFGARLVGDKMITKILFTGASYSFGFVTFKIAGG